jgi:hypothetical protein
MALPPSQSPQQPTQTTIATAADYADAMFIARRGRTIFGMVVIAMLLIQLAIFATYRFSSALDKYIETPAASSASPSTATTAPTTMAAVPEGNFGRQMLKYIIGLSGFFGLMFSILLSLTLLLLLNIMLIGRLIGISHVTSAFMWSLVVLVLVFPWQAFMNNQDLTRPEFKVPGVLYNWDEVTHNANFEWSQGLHVNVLRWARFLIMPIVTLVLVLTVLTKSGKGLRMALGEASPSGGGGSAPPKKKKREDEYMDDDTLNDRNILT